jgi:hypothetical protein
MQGDVLNVDREEIEVDQPLLTVDRQMGLVIVTPDGKVGSRSWRDGAWLIQTRRRGQSSSACCMTRRGTRVSYIVSYRMQYSQVTADTIQAGQ